MNRQKKYSALAVLLLVAVLVVAATNTAGAQDSCYFNAIKYYNLGEDSLARENFLKYSECNPKSDAAYYYLARLYAKARNLDESRDMITRAILLDSTNLEYQKFLANIFLNQNNVAVPISIYEKLIEKAPKKLDYYYLLADMYIASKQTDKAKQIIDKIETTGGKNEMTLATRMRLYKMEDNLNDAIDYIKDFDKERQSPQAQTMLGDLYIERRNDSLALECYDKALEHDSDYIPALYGKVDTYRIRRDFPNFFGGLNSLLRNVNLPLTEKIDYIQNLVKIPVIVKNFKPQLDNLMTTLDNTYPTDTSATAMTSIYFLTTGDSAKGVEIMERTVKTEEPTLLDVKKFIALMFYLEQYDYLEKVFTGKGDEQVCKAMKLLPEVEKMCQLGLTQARQRKMDDALASFKKAEKLCKQENNKEWLGDVYATMGDIYNSTDNRVNSNRYYQKAIDSGNYDSAVLNNYAYNLSIMGKNLQKAYDMSMAALKKDPENVTYLDTFGWILYKQNKLQDSKQVFKKSLVYGGSDNAVLLDHYAEVLFKLAEYDLAFIYWNQAKNLDKNNELKLEQKIEEYKKLVK